jgi:predicted AlkP superfamily phosphohydrolase/phosphomutase
MSGDDSGSSETLLIGIDAGCLPVFERLFEADCTPVIEGLCTEGILAPLESQIPPWTPSAWPSMYTGTNPGKHGAFGFADYEGYDWEILNATHVREHALWELLDIQGLTSVVVNVPVTYPPGEIDGAIVPGFMGPEDPECHPPGLLDEVREAIGDYGVYRSYDVDSDEFTDAEKIDDYCSRIRMRGAAYRYLADRFDPDFGFVEFQHSDKLFHEFGGDDWGKVETVYRAVDEEIGRVLEERDPERVFIASDHGIGKYGGQEVFLNECLREKGYVETTPDERALPSWSPIRSNLREGDESESHNLRPDDERAERREVDVAASVAYMRHRSEFGVRINLEGREPSGVVAPEEYDAVREALIADLKDLATPDGTPVFERAVPSEEVFAGPERERAVDVVTVPSGFDHHISTTLPGTVFADVGGLWNHRLHGMFAAAGDGIDAGALEDAHLFDVAPTVMTAMGVPYSDRMDGRVLPILDGEGEATTYPEYEPSRQRTEADGSDDAAVKRRLADLGYLE